MGRTRSLLAICAVLLFLLAAVALVAAAGLALGVILAELLVPAITVFSLAAEPVPPVLIQFGWPIPRVHRGGSLVAWSDNRKMVSLSGRTVWRPRPDRRR